LRNPQPVVTFFVVGQNVAAREAVVKRAFDAGHRIGNHSYTHPDLTKLAEPEVFSEIKRTDDLISRYAGEEKVFRPPYGSHNAKVDRVAARLGYRVVLWSVDTLDWDKHYQPDKWVQHGIDQIRNRDSSRVLNHDIHKTTADNYDTFIRRIVAIGSVIFEPPSTL
jgi:peptidoglycan/xylan/chitin deacetylase (PgdA/CDA1 family)